MPNTNFVIIEGLLGKAPDLSKKPYRISVATTVGYDDKKRTLWHDVTVWDDNVLAGAEKGDIAHIIAHLDYTQKEDKRYMNIVADAVQIRKKKSSKAAAPAAKNDEWETE